VPVFRVNRDIAGTGRGAKEGRLEGLGVRGKCECRAGNDSLRTGAGGRLW
jgi:hypothetical protein